MLTEGKTRSNIKNQDKLSKRPSPPSPMKPNTKNIEQILKDSVKEVNVLNLTENSVLIVHINVDHLTAFDIDKHMLYIKKVMNPIKEKFNCEILYVSQLTGKESKFEVIGKENIEKRKCSCEDTYIKED